MFEALKRFIADVSSGPGDETGFAPDDDRLAAAALLVHVAAVDGRVDPAERARLREIIEQRFGLDAAGTTRLIEEAEARDREAVDFFHFTAVLKRRLDEEGRRRVVEMMWDVVFADGAVSEFEENVVWRVAELLGVSARDRVALRRKVAAEEQPAPEHAGPWSGTPAKD